MKPKRVWSEEERDVSIHLSLSLSLSSSNRGFDRMKRVWWVVAADCDANVADDWTGSSESCEQNRRRCCCRLDNCTCATLDKWFFRPGLSEYGCDTCPALRRCFCRRRTRHRTEHDDDNETDEPDMCDSNWAPSNRSGQKGRCRWSLCSKAPSTRTAKTASIDVHCTIDWTRRTMVVAAMNFDRSACLQTLPETWTLRTIAMLRAHSESAADATRWFHALDPETSRDEKRRTFRTIRTGSNQSRMVGAVSQSKWNHNCWSEEWPRWTANRTDWPEPLR